MRKVVGVLCVALLASVGYADELVASQGFESAITSPWNAFDGDLAGDYYWGRTDGIDPIPEGAYCGWCCADGTQGQSYVPLTDLYPLDWDSWLDCGPLDFSDATGGYADFWYYVDSQSVDELTVLLSIDGGNSYSEMWSFGGYSGPDWTYGYVDLGDLVTYESDVYVAFVFSSGTGDSDYGAFLDDIEIYKTYPADDGDGDTVIICGQLSDGSGLGAALLALLLIGGAAVLRRRSARQAG